MDKFAWSYENEDSLIEMYKARPCLYDTNSIGFHNRNYKHKARQEIADALDVPVAVVTKHMESLRTQLCRLIKPLPSGVAQPRVTARQQWLLDTLDFLIPHMKKRNHRSKLCSSNELMLEADESNQSGEGEGGDDSINAEGIKFVSDLDENDWSSHSYATNDMSTAYRRPSIVAKPNITNHYVKRRRIDEDAHTLDSPLMSDVKPDTSIFLSKEVEEVDDDAVFGSHLVRQMRQITDVGEKLKAQNKISNILFDARMKVLELQNTHSGSVQKSSCQSSVRKLQSSHSNTPACHCSVNLSNGHLSRAIEHQTDFAGSLSNDELKSKVQSLHNNIVNRVDPSSLIDYLFSHNILDSKSLLELSSIADRKQQCRRLLVNLHNTNNPKTFVIFRQAVRNDGELEWLGDLIDSPNPETTGYRERPQILGPLNVPNDDEVAGVAHVDGFFVVVRANSDTLWVFDGLAPFCRRDDVHIDGLQNPVDAASCEKNGKLYIAESNSDKEQSCVWRVEIKSGKADRLVFVNFQPTALSVAYGRIVVTAGDLAKIFVFSAENGCQLKQIELQSHAIPWHALETPRGSYIVCQPGEDHIVEIDAVNGSILQKCELDNDALSEQFVANGMLRAALDRVSGYSFVVDSTLNRVVLVDSNLRFERVVLGKVDELKAPRLLFYASESGTLVVSGDSGTYVFAMK